MKVLLVVNPTASSVTPKVRDAVRKALAADHEVEMAFTKERGHAEQLARDAAGAGADAVVVLAGDGTLNEAANGLVGTQTALAALPGGSTNVFARTAGSVTNALRATEQVRVSLRRGDRRRIGLGRVNERYFLFHVGMGYDAAVVAQVERRPSLKRRVSQAIFVYASFTAWFRDYDHSRPRLSVRFPDGGEVPDGYFAICLNSDPYTYLGPRPLSLAPGVGFDDPLAVVTLKTLAARSLLGAVGTALVGKRGVQGRRGVDYRAGVDQLEVVGHGPFPYQVDGDYLGEVDQLSLRHEPGVLDLVVPADPASGGADGAHGPGDGSASGRSA